MLKLRDEEVILTQHFSEEYLAYKKNTRNLNSLRLVIGRAM